MFSPLSLSSRSPPQLYLRRARVAHPGIQLGALTNHSTVDTYARTHLYTSFTEYTGSHCTAGLCLGLLAGLYTGGMLWRATARRQPRIKLMYELQTPRHCLADGLRLRSLTEGKVPRKFAPILLTAHRVRCHAESVGLSLLLMSRR